MKIESEPESVIGFETAVVCCQSFSKIVVNNFVVAVLTVTIFYLSLLVTSSPVDSPYDMETINQAIALLDSKGFDREVFLLRHAATFRATDSWLNDLTANENSYAATNFPFGLITLSADFYAKTQDDTERAMILLHEAQHLQGKDERAAYEYVWRNRQKLDWTQLSHGGTQTFITTELQTRENSPYLFTCPAKVWNDCTETLLVGRLRRR